MDWTERMEELLRLLKQTSPAAAQLAEIKKIIENNKSRIKMVSIQQQLDHRLSTLKATYAFSPIARHDLPKIVIPIETNGSEATQKLLNIQRESQVGMYEVEEKIRHLNDKLEQIKPALNTLTLLSDLFKQISRVQGISTHARAKMVLFDHLFVCAEELGQSTCEEILETLNSDEDMRIQEQHIEALVIAAFPTQKIRELSSSWVQNTDVIPRMHILNDCITAYENEQYNLCIPALLAQTEGLIAKHYNHHGQMGGGKYKEYISKLCADGTDPYLCLLEDFICDTLLEHFEHGQTAIPRFSRHAILHGGDVRYGTQGNALRALLMFDYVQRICA